MTERSLLDGPAPRLARSEAVKNWAVATLAAVVTALLVLGTVLALTWDPLGDLGDDDVPSVGTTCSFELADQQGRCPGDAGYDPGAS